MPGYGIETGAEGMLPWSFVSQQMAASRNYWIVSASPDGQPHAAPVWGVWHDETFYFGTGPGSRKGRNLASNPRVVVHLESGDDTVIFEGVVERVTDATLLQRVADVYEAKYSFRPADEPLEDQPMLALRPHKAYAWLERSYPQTATRWEFT